MLKKIFIFLLFFICILLVILFSLNFIKTKKTQIVSTKNDVFLSVTPITEKISFILQKESIDKTNKIITVKLDGPVNIKADAIDLRLDFNDNIQIVKINNGDSFSSYPRKRIKNNYLLITGVALDQNNIFYFAKPKTTFVKIQYKIIDLNKQAIIFLNTKESKIFLSGTDITALYEKE